MFSLPTHLFTPKLEKYVTFFFFCTAGISNLGNYLWTSTPRIIYYIFGNAGKLLLRVSCALQMPYKLNSFLKIACSKVIDVFEVKMSSNQTFRLD